MANSDSQSIAYAEHVPDGLLIVFVDGESAIYPAIFLRRALIAIKNSEPLIAHFEEPSLTVVSSLHRKQ